LLFVVKAIKKWAAVMLESIEYFKLFVK